MLNPSHAECFLLTLDTYDIEGWGSMKGRDLLLPGITLAGPRTIPLTVVPAWPPARLGSHLFIAQAAESQGLPTVRGSAPF